jgi:DNA repair protein RecN (Recombination protein N)
MVMALAAAPSARDGSPVLIQLSVANIALIEELSIEPTRGFNVLTGETGAGKSMVVDALNLVLGGRARPDLVRRGAKEAEVEALFEVEPGSSVAVKLEAAGIRVDEEVTVRRLVHAEGRSRAFLNGHLSTATQLADLAAGLCDISSQHESVSLTDPATHIDYLDSFGELRLAREALATMVDELSSVSAALDAIRQEEQGRSEREEFLRFQLHEIDELDPRAGEEHELENERTRLRHAERLSEATRRSAERLSEGEGAVCDELARISSELERAALLDDSISPLARAVEGSRLELADAGRALARYAEGIQSSPERLAEVDDRLFRLQSLLRRHGPTTEDLLAYRAAVAKELESLSTAEERISGLVTERLRRLEAASSAARALSTRRRDAAARLGDAIERELAHLAMGRAKVVVEVARVTSSVSSGTEGGLTVDGARLTRNGMDRVEFLIAPNKGEDPRPLRRIASGGELSRSLLALKRVLADSGPAGLYVFDEVDAGVGGAVAEVIGRAIADIARHRQVLCVTHLPQIAALADTHFVIEKSETKGRTRASLRRLADGKARIDEVARMMGGVTVGQAARRAAEELLATRTGTASKSY